MERIFLIAFSTLSFALWLYYVFWSSCFLQVVLLLLLFRRIILNLIRVRKLRIRLLSTLLILHYQQLIVSFMASVFNKIGDIKNDVKRNSFDWSHDNNFTTDLGRITPVFTELVPPNSSVRIKPEFGLRFMPMMFPIQTKMKAYLSFFKVPLRTLWKDYMDFISADNTEEYQPPFIDFPRSAFTNGALAESGLGDYFGIPVGGESTTVWTPVSATASYLKDSSSAYLSDSIKNSTYSAVYDYQAVSMTQSQMVPTLVTSDDACRVIPSNNGLMTVRFGTVNYSQFTSPFIRLVFTTKILCQGETGGLSSSDLADALMNLNRCGSPYFGLSVSGTPYPASSVTDNQGLAVGTGRFSDKEFLPDSQIAIVTFTGSVEFNATDLSLGGSAPSTLYLNLTMPCVSEYLQSSGVTANSFSSNCILGSHIISTSASSFSSLSAFESTGSSSLNSPYYSVLNHTSSAIKISAYPFRAYEAIYNAYIRNTRNNPFVLDGKKTYNKWITNDEGGADSTTPLDLRYANWLSDAFTTALQSPQQGTTPLVGLTTYETQSVNEAGHTVTTVNTAIVDEDGDAFKVDFESNGEALKGVNYTPLKSGEMVNAQALVSPVTSGISINDFRNVNAYQRYLELNQFRGFSYKEIIEGRFDVNVRYDSLNMPEYLGGITRDVIVNPITQTVETTSDGSYQGALGSQAGFATCFGNSDGSISVFCDEESIIMGIMYVMPMPVYDSVIPKWLMYRNRLDSFSPEFDHIGYQPIYIKELAAVQAYEKGLSLDTVFGYQRPWYEYVQKLDRAHGLFLSSLRNFIMYRSFSDAPELGSSFTVMQPGSVNNVFSVTEVSDKILGQIHFNCTAQLPISRVVVPRLE